MRGALRSALPRAVGGRPALAAAAHTSAPPPSNMRGTFVNRSPKLLVAVGSSSTATFHHSQATTDCGARPVPLRCVGGYRPPIGAYCKFASAFTSAASRSGHADSAEHLLGAVNEAERCLHEQSIAELREHVRFRDGGTPAHQQLQQLIPPQHYGDRVEELGAYWGQKFFGNVTHGPRNYGYSWSRWYVRRYSMKKHRYTKRWKLRRYKLASVANLPFSKMIRINMLPELKSKKGVGKAGATFDVDSAAAPTVATQIVTAANAASGGGRVGKRKRPKSKYT